MKKRVFAVFTAIALAAALFVGCGSKDKTADGTEPVPIEIFSTGGGRIAKEDDPVVAEVGKRTNTKITLTDVSGTEMLNKFGVLVASDTVPEISVLMNFDYFQFIDQGVFLPLEDLLEEYGQDIKKTIPDQKAWDLVKYHDKQYAIPYVNVPGKYSMVTRQDWLDKLGLEVPTTLDEFTEMLRQFTNNDPDGNGQNDTCGLTAQGSGNSAYLTGLTTIFGAFGMQPQQYYINGDTVTASSISEEYKASLEYLAQIYSEHLVDQEIFINNGDQSTQKLVQGKVGCAVGWWSLPSDLMGTWKMGEVNPNAAWVVIPPFTGPDGSSGNLSRGIVGNTVSISSKMEHPEAAMKLLDYICTDEGYNLVNYGIPGVHNTAPGVLTEEGQQAMNERWLDSLAQIIFDVNKWQDYQRTFNAENWPYIEAAADAKLYDSDMYGIITPEYNSLFPDVKKLEEEWLIKFVTGAESIDKFDQYKAEWLNKGGREIAESLVAEYNSRNHTNLTFSE